MLGYLLTARIEGRNVPDIRFVVGAKGRWFVAERVTLALEVVHPPLLVFIRAGYPPPRRFSTSLALSERSEVLPERYALSPVT